MVERNLYNSLKSLFKLNFILLLVNTILTFFWGILNDSEIFWSMSVSLPILLFVESAILLLFGGFRAFSSFIFLNKVREHFFKSKEEWSGTKNIEKIKESDFYVFEGLLLLIESILLGFLLE
jgi:hypothetical protein